MLTTAFYYPRLCSLCFQFPTIELYHTDKNLNHFGPLIRTTFIADFSQLCGHLVVYEVNFGLLNLLKHRICLQFCFDISKSTDLRGTQKSKQEIKTKSETRNRSMKSAIGLCTILLIFNSSLNRKSNLS